VNAAAYIKENGADIGEPTLDHVREYIRDLEAAGVARDRLAPMLLPDYTTPDVRKHQLTAHYAGTMR
jgi:hypothetical protein